MVFHDCSLPRHSRRQNHLYLVKSVPAFLGISPPRLRFFSIHEADNRNHDIHQTGILSLPAFIADIAIQLQRIPACKLFRGMNINHFQYPRHKRTQIWQGRRLPDTGAPDFCRIHEDSRLMCGGDVSDAIHRHAGIPGYRRYSPARSVW